MPLIVPSTINGAGKYVWCMVAVGAGMILLAFTAFLLHQSGWSAGDLAPLLAGEMGLLGVLNVIGALMVAYLHTKVPAAPAPSPPPPAPPPGIRPEVTSAVEQLVDAYLHRRGWQ